MLTASFMTLSVLYFLIKIYCLFFDSFSNQKLKQLVLMMDSQGLKTCEAKLGIYRCVDNDELIFSTGPSLNLG